MLKKLEAVIIKSVEEFVLNNELFKFRSVEFVKYEEGVFKFLSSETETNIPAAVYYDPYAGQVTALFKNCLGQYWSLGRLDCMEIIRKNEQQEVATLKQELSKALKHRNEALNMVAKIGLENKQLKCEHARIRNERIDRVEKTVCMSCEKVLSEIVDSRDVFSQFAARN